MSNDATSITLLERLRDASDNEAWQRFNDLYGPLVRRWLVGRGVAPHDADDVIQELMQLAVAQLGRFEHNGNVGALRCWLRQAMVNRLRTIWRQRNRAAIATGSSDYQAIAEQLEDPNSGLSQVWDQEYQRVVLQHLLACVEGEFQDRTMEAFRAVAIEGRSASQVAESLGMSANAVRISQSRVLRRLRELGQGMLD